jgi:hypothetical protein
MLSAQIYWRTLQACAEETYMRILKLGTTDGVINLSWSHRMFIPGLNPRRNNIDKCCFTNMIVQASAWCDISATWLCKKITHQPIPQADEAPKPGTTLTTPIDLVTFDMVAVI